jgi:heptaprenyl diphosphate synthase
MRIGLANLPLLLGLEILSPENFVLLVLIKVLGQGIVSGALFSYVFLFSLAGTFCSAALMFSLRRLLGKRIGFAGMGTAGAFLSNAVQLLLARFFVFGVNVAYLVPPFLVSGVVTGFTLGLFCENFCARSLWYEKVRGRTLELELRGPEEPEGREKNGGRTSFRLKRREIWDGFFRSEDLFAAGIFMMIAFLFTSSLTMRIVQFFFFWLLAFLSGKKNNPLITLMVILGIVIFNLLAPYGRVLAEAGPFRITEGSLLSGLGKGLSLEGLIMLSGACIRPGLRLPGPLGKLLGESFVILQSMQERKFTIRGKWIIEGIDTMLLELDAETIPEQDAMPGTRPARQGNAVRRRPASLFCLAAMALLPAALSVISRIL